MNYRKLWESYYGPIPKDKDGRSYDIHHIDGNKLNNKISNLMCISIQEHYDIHHRQGDWAACILLALRMGKTPGEISLLSKNHALRRIADGSHHFLKGGPRPDLLGDKNPMRNPRIAKKMSEIQTGKKRSLETRAKNRKAALNRKRATCFNCGIESDIANLKRWHGQNCTASKQPKQYKNQEWECEYCGKIGKGNSNYIRWHGHNCKSKK